MHENFPFSDAPDTACIICRHVLEERSPIVYIFHDEDGCWQFLCGEEHTEYDARVVSLAEILDIDSSVADFADLGYGKYAERSAD